MSAAALTESTFLYRQAAEKVVQRSYLLFINTGV